MQKRRREYIGIEVLLTRAYRRSSIIIIPRRRLVAILRAAEVKERSYNKLLSNLLAKKE